MASKFNFGGFDSKAKRAMRDSIVEISEMAKNHYVRSFRNQGFTDETKEAWKPRKKEDNKRYGRAILVDSGDLRRSVEVKRIDLNGLKIVIGSDLPYAAIHNYGLNGKAWGKYPFKMPQRQFIGKSEQVDKKAIKIIDKRIDNLFK